MLGLFHFLQTEVQPKLSRKTNQKRKVFVYVGHWPRQSWGPRRRRSRTLCRRGLCAALPTAKPKRKKKKKKVNLWTEGVRWNYTEKNLPFYCVSCFFSCLLCFFSTYFWSVWDFELYKFGRFLYFGLKYKKPSRMLGYVGCTLFSANKRCSWENSKFKYRPLL